MSCCDDENPNRNRQQATEGSGLSRAPWTIRVKAQGRMLHLVGEERMLMLAEGAEAVLQEHEQLRL